MKTLPFVLAISLLVGVSFAAQDKKQSGPSEADAKVIAEQLPSYPANTVCLVSDEAMGGEEGEPINYVHEGRLIRLCCHMCVKEVTADPEALFKKLDAAVIAAQTPSYPLTTCTVSGKELGSMGDPIDVVHGTRLARLCCKGCVKSFRSDPAKTLAEIDAALIAAQTKTYPLKVCLVSGEELGSMGDPIDVLYGTRLARLCCKGCVKRFKAKPEELLAQVAAASKAAK